MDVCAQYFSFASIISNYLLQFDLGIVGFNILGANLTIRDLNTHMQVLGCDTFFLLQVLTQANQWRA